MVKKYLLTATLVTLVHTPVLAQQAAPTFDNMKPVASYSFQTIAPVLQAIGTQAQTAQSEDGATYLKVTSPNGFGFNIALAACTDKAQQQCRGMALAAIWDAENKFTSAQVAQNTQAFNLKYRFTSSGVRADGRPYIQRYAIADFGTNQGNIRAEIEAFIAIGSIFHSEALGNS